MGDVYIDANDEVVEGQFTSYQHGTTLPYTKWSGGEPNNVNDNENCVVMWPTAMWNDARCMHHAAYMCKYLGMRSNHQGGVCVYLLA